MTEFEYQKNSYLKQIEAKVLNVEGTKILLDRTIFYPCSGGQPADKGVLECNGIKFQVINVKKEGSNILHEVDKEGLSVGQSVNCVIDWEFRHKMMRGHTACHILSYVVNESTGALITGNQIGEDKCRVDFDLENFDRDQLKVFEQKANEIISSGANVQIRFLPREEAFAIPSVLKLKNVLPPSVDVIRIVEITGYDIQACGGTHVKNVSEIGKITITKAENKGKNNRRMYFEVIG
jgi:misacylated tRNA(Ala) deacylase